MDAHVDLERAFVTETTMTLLTLERNVAVVVDTHVLAVVTSVVERPGTGDLEL